MKKVCGLVVHKDTMFLCILAENGQTFLQEFGTLTPKIEEMLDLIKDNIPITNFLSPEQNKNALQD